MKNMIWGRWRWVGRMIRMIILVAHLLSYNRDDSPNFHPRRWTNPPTLLARVGACVITCGLCSALEFVYCVLCSDFEFLFRITAGRQPQPKDPKCDIAPFAP